MLLIDTSVWINVLPDKSGNAKANFQSKIGERQYYLPIFCQMELLQGCKDEAEWQKLYQYLSVQRYVVPDYSQIWFNAARLYFELRRKGITVRSNIDCAIALCAMENNLLLYHCDRNFEQIAQYTVLKQNRLEL
ncbi:PIN domain-containing protein [Pleurocapsa sp. PCC 7319]|uniref:type II toxin-antitoxin system VapC family toxin n=1 Tax=Pleurocapsa sp. PCC 7319 TaxID=118161 RepID=UPI00034A3714|nr:PIN domain-containing protein [Pleurocapsa sp. PCC 7319]